MLLKDGCAPAWDAVKEALQSAGNRDTGKGTWYKSSGSTKTKWKVVYAHRVVLLND